jgi:protein tyrosine phosphatase (PTP) superfamily phosphohydrolase (DUF442 family)
MTRRFLISVAVSLLLLGLLAGCANRCRQPFTATCPNRCSPCAPSAGVPGVPPPPSAIPAGPVPVGVVAPAPPAEAGIPPAPAPTPGGSPLYPAGTPGASLSPSAPSPANPSTPDTRFSSPAPLADHWQPAAPQAGVRLSGPEAGAQAGAQEQRDNVRLQPPGTPEPPAASAKPAVVEQRIPPAASPSLPVGIPEFAVIVPEKVTAGQKPSLEAFDWLKSNNYRTVVHLLKPGEPDGARAQFERRGLKYQTIEVSDARLGQAVEEFNRAISAADSQPVFVYDRDGSLAGPLWYLRFRSVDRLADDEARRKATSLGLRDDGTGDSISLWVAIQEYLRKNK